jgi:hypothetical protein
MKLSNLPLTFVQRFIMKTYHIPKENERKIDQHLKMPFKFVMSHRKYFTFFFGKKIDEFFQNWIFVNFLKT